MKRITVLIWFYPLLLSSLLSRFPGDMKVGEKGNASILEYVSLVNVNENICVIAIIQ